MIFLNKNSVNFIVRVLILSDFFLFFSAGLLSPIFAVFVLDGIDGGNLKVIGFATAFYWLARVLMVVPFSRLMDRIKGERDEYIFMMIGSVAMSILPLFYIFSSHPWHIYLIQFLFGCANSLAIPAWRIIFTNHLDRRNIGYEWSLEDVGVGLATALSAAGGALLADRFGFEVLFFFIATIGVIGSAILLLIKKDGNFLPRLLSNKQEKGLAPFKNDKYK